MSPATFRRDRPSSGAGAILVAELNADLLARYPNPLPAHYDLSDDDVEPGDGTFLIGSINGVDVACGAIRRFEASVGELKRMFVRTSHRGLGIARALLSELEAEAERLRFSRILLETGERSPAAIGLYRSAGYRPIARYGQYVDSPVSVCMSKELTGPN
jgi:GNAT superfamily N-acetyltransferase